MLRIVCGLAQSGWCNSEVSPIYKAESLMLKWVPSFGQNESNNAWEEFIFSVMWTNPLTQVPRVLTSFPIVSMAKARLYVIFEYIWDPNTWERVPWLPIWPSSATCAQGFHEDEDADLADELLVGFEEGVPCLKFHSWILAETNVFFQVPANLVLASAGTMYLGLTYIGSSGVLNLRQSQQHVLFD